MKPIALAVMLLLLPTAFALAGDEGGADYGLPFAAGAVLDDSYGNNPLRTASYVEITGADLVAWGAQTAADALPLAAGVFVYHADRWTERGETLARVRGAGPTGLQIFVDGMPVSHALFGAADLADLPADQISRLRIYPGPAPAIFGAEGGAGVIEIVTRQAGEDFTTRFDGRFGDRRMNLFSLGLGDTFHALQYFATASSYTAAGAPLPASYDASPNENGGRRDGSAFNRNHYRARIGALLGDAGSAHATLFYDSTDREVPYDAVNPLTEVYRFPDINRIGGQLNLRLGAFGPFHLQGTAYLYDLDEQRDEYADTAYADLLRERHFRQKRAGGDLTPTLDFGAYSRASLRLYGQRDEAEFFIQDRHHTRFFLQRLGAAADDELLPLGWLQVSAGAGFAQLDPLRSDTLAAGDPLTVWHGRLAATADPLPQLGVRLAAGRNPSLPTVEQWFDRTLGDPDLTAETIDNVELALLGRLPGQTRLTLTGFAQRRTDGIMLIENKTGDGLVFANEADWLSHGLTLEAVAQPLTGLYLSANGTYEKVLDEESGDGIQPLYVPEVSGAAEARYRFPMGFGLAVNVQAAGERADIVDGREYTMKAYALTGARLFYSYRDRVEVYAQGHNLFDVPYETNRFFPEPGRTYNAGLKLTY